MRKKSDHSIAFFLKWVPPLLQKTKLFPFFFLNCHSKEGRILDVKLPHFSYKKTLFAIFFAGIFSQDPPTNTRDISMDIHIWPTYLKKFCPNFFFGKSLARKYPTYLQFGHMSKISYFFLFWIRSKLFKLFRHKNIMRSK